MKKTLNSPLLKDWQLMALVASPVWGAMLIAAVTAGSQVYVLHKMQSDIEGCIAQSAGPLRPAPYQVSEDCRVKIAGPNAAIFQPPPFVNYAHP